MKSNYFREALGLTQEELALLLRVAKSHIAMFEIGQRLLPSKAMLKLVNMYNYMQEKEQEKLQHIDLKSENAKIVKLVEKELAKNKYKQIQIERKLTRIQSNYQKSLSTLQLVKYLETQLQEDEKRQKELIGILQGKALIIAKENGLSDQKKLELKLNVLQQYQKGLEKELKQYKL